MAEASFFSFDFIKNKLKAGRNYARKGAKTGFFHILGGNTLVQVVSALAVLLYPRIMGKDYSTFTAANTYLNYLLIFNGFGLANGILRYCAVFEKPEDKKGYFVYALKFGVVSDFILIAVYCGGMYILKKFFHYSIAFGSADIFAMLIFTSFLVYIFQALQYYLRANKENKLFSSTSVVFTAAYAGLQMLVALIFKLFGRVMEGATLGRYISYFIAIGFALYMMRKLPGLKAKAAKLKKAEKIGMIKYSANYMVANSFSQLMPNNENALVMNMVSNPDFGDFSAAQIAPSSVTFISSSVMVYAFPYFAKNYRDGNWIYKNTKKLVLGLTALMAVITFLGVLLSPAIVLIFGKKFQTPNAINLSRLFFIAYGVSGAVRMPVGNVLAAVGEVKFNIINSAITFAVHLMLCWYLTSHFGIGGAAYGLLIGYILSSAISYIYLVYYCKKVERRKLQADEKDLL